MRLKVGLSHVCHAKFITLSGHVVMLQQRWQEIVGKKGLVVMSGPNLCREVETLFHECGHALQHMLTQQEEGLVAGIR